MRLLLLTFNDMKPTIFNTPLYLHLRPDVVVSALAALYIYVSNVSLLIYCSKHVGDLHAGPTKQPAKSVVTFLLLVTVDILDAKLVIWLSSSCHP